MRDLWERFHSDLEKSLSTPDAARAFVSLASRRPSIAAFSDGAALAWHLGHDRDGLDSKEAIYADLVTEVRDAGPSREVARTLIWLGLWGGLDHAYRRLLLRYQRDAGLDDDDRRRALVSEVIHQGNSLIERIDPAVVSRIAADIVRSVRRDVMRVIATADNVAATHDELPDDTQYDDERIQRTPPQLRTEPDEDNGGIEMVFGIPRHLPLEEQIAILRVRLRAIVGDDADLLIHVLVLDATQEDFARARNLNPATVRQRFRRAQKRLRSHIERSRS